MGFHTAPVQVSLVLAALCAAGAWAAAAGPASATELSQCGLGRYWSKLLQRCVDCSPCAGAGREVTLRPCSAYRDAQCGSVTDLHIDWSWMHSHHGQPDARPARPEARADRSKTGLHERISSLTEAEALLRDELRHLPPPQQQRDRLVDFGDDYVLPDHPRQPRKHRKPRPRPAKPFSDLDDFADFGASGVGEPVSDDEDLARASWRRAHSRHRTPPTPAASAPPAAAPSAATTTTTTTTTARPQSPVGSLEDFIVIKDTDGDAGEADARLRPDVVATSPTFSTAETLVWDWQAGVLVAAVCACLLFFFVAAVYSCQHALHFKRLKKHLDADMEEISARLALMSGISSEHFHDPGATGSTGATPEKAAFAVRRGDHLRTGRQQNEYCVASLPRKTRV